MAFPTGDPAARFNGSLDSQPRHDLHREQSPQQVFPAFLRLTMERITIATTSASAVRMTAVPIFIPFPFLSYARAAFPLAEAGRISSQIIAAMAAKPATVHTPKGV